MGKFMYLPQMLPLRGSICMEFESNLTKENIVLPLGCLQGGLL